MDASVPDRAELVNLARLLLEDVCSDLVRYLHSPDDSAGFGTVRVDREFALGPPGAYADLRVQPQDAPAYFLEVKYGHDTETLLARVRRKYATLGGAPLEATKLVLVVDVAEHADWPAAESALRAFLPPHLALEIWDESRLEALMAECFGQTIESFAAPDLLAIRELTDEGREQRAFGHDGAASYAEAVLRQNLLWSFSSWRLRELADARGSGNPAQLVPAGVYPHVVALMADMSSFSRYVRDTPDEAIVRESLTNFYAKARYQVINAGGMLLQFVGDEVVALFGIPDRRPGYVEAATHTACRLLDIGSSVAHHWQRQIDHIEPDGGVHIGMAMGRVQLVQLRALDHGRLAAIGDCLNLAGRLVSLASPGQIMVSNVLHHALDGSRYEFLEQAPFEARNVGTIRPWRLIPPATTPTASLG
jgi:class 3 adenylate cyclase